jgi:hypothetical protein
MPRRKRLRRSLKNSQYLSYIHDLVIDMSLPDKSILMNAHTRKTSAGERDDESKLCAGTKRSSEYPTMLPNTTRTTSSIFAWVISNPSLSRGPPRTTTPSQPPRRFPTLMMAQVSRHRVSLIIIIIMSSQRNDYTGYLIILSSMASRANRKCVRPRMQRSVHHTIFVPLNVMTRSLN